MERVLLLLDSLFSLLLVEYLWRDEICERWWLVCMGESL